MCLRAAAFLIVVLLPIAVAGQAPEPVFGDGPIPEHAPGGGDPIASSRAAAIRSTRSSSP